MKHLVPVLALLLTAPAAALDDLAPGVLLPKPAGAWAPAADPEDPARPQEVTPGHFYLLRPARASGWSALLHATDPAALASASTRTNLEAHHLVTEFPLAEARLERVQDQWRLRGRKAGAESWQSVRLAWAPLAPLPERRPTAVLRVALFDDHGSYGQGVPRCVELLGAEPRVAVSRVRAAQIREGGLRDFDVVVFSGGSGGRQATALGLTGREQVRRFVEAGGGYLGICAGHYLACAGFSWSVPILDARTKSPKWRRGIGEVQVEGTAAGRELLGLSAGRFGIRYANGPVFQPAGIDALPDYQPLAVFRTELAENGSPPGVQTDSPAMVLTRYGRGRVLCSSPHPEQQPGLETFLLRAVEAVAPRG